MELPHLGQHCSEVTCNRLDFLPVKCDSCQHVFCSNHFSYASHACPSAHRKDVQVPVCPLCGEPVPTPPGTSPDLTVGQHIDQQCKSESRKIFTNRCSYKSCKRKELIPVTCGQCKRNFCLRHRHTTDHECQAAKQTTNGGMSDAEKRKLAANAAEYRRTNKPTSLFNASNFKAPATAQAPRVTDRQMQNMQGNMTEDEALARAMALSIMELDEAADRNRRDELAQQSNNTVPAVGGRDAQQTNNKDKCSLS